MKRMALLLLALAAALTSSGCYSKQINHINFVTALGIEPAEDGGVLVHALIAVPLRYASLSPSGGGEPQDKHGPNFVLSQSGKNVSEALFKMKTRTARDLQFGHTKVVLFSREMAKHGLEKHLDFFMRRQEVQMISWLALTEGSPRDVLRTTPETPESLTDLLVDIFSRAGSDSFEILPIYLYEYFSYEVQPGITPYAMYVRRIPGGNRIEVPMLGLFREGKLVGSLDSDEIKYLQIVRRTALQSTTFTITAGDISFTLLDFETLARVRDDELDLRIRLELDTDQSEEPLRTNAEIREAERKMAEDVKRQIEALLTKLQRLKVDPVGFGEKYRVASGGSLDKERWLRTVWPNMKLNVDIHADIARRSLVD